MDELPSASARLFGVSEYTEQSLSSFAQKGTSGLVVVHLVGKVNFQQRVPEPAAVLVDAEHRRAQTKQEHVELSSRWRWEEEQFISKDKSWCRSRRGD